MHCLPGFDYHRRQRAVAHSLRHYAGAQVWFIVDDFAVTLTKNQETLMTLNQQDNQIANLSLAGNDAAGLPITPVFDSAPQWSLSDTTPPSGAVLTVASDGMTATLSAGTVGQSVTVNVVGSVKGKTYSASLSVMFIAGDLASISIVATLAPAPITRTI